MTEGPNGRPGPALRLCRLYPLAVQHRLLNLIGQDGKMARNPIEHLSFLRISGKVPDKSGRGL